MSAGKKVSIVTGFDTNLGKAITSKLAELGYAVVAQVPNGVEASSDNENVIIVKYDIQCADASRALVESCAEKLGERICVLVNAAHYIPCRDFLNSTVEDYREAVYVNVLGTMHMIHFVLPWMLKHHFGEIINISDVSSFGDPKNAVLGATMGGINGLTKLMAVDYSELGISTNTVTCSMYDDELNCPSPTLRETFEDIADACAYLISNPKISGHNIVFSGGKPVL